MRLLPLAINLSQQLSNPYTIPYYTKEKEMQPRDDDDVALGIDDDAIPEDEFDTLEEKYGLK